MIPAAFNIIPVLDKIPQIPWREFTEREQTIDERADILKLYPNGYKGIVTGKISGVFVLDDDGGLDLKRYKIPLTRTVKTPRGGTHYYFRWVPELEGKVTTKIGVLEKVDIRGEGGYVVFYGWDKRTACLPFARPPQWLLDMLTSKDQQLPVVQSSSWMIDELDAIVKGDGEHGRTPTFVRVIGRLKAKGLKAEEVEGLLEPWAVKNDYGRLHVLIEDQYKRYPPKPVEDSGNSIEEFLLNNESVDWICPGIIANKSFGFVAGLPETGKTWIMIDLAIEAARGGKWLNKFDTKKSRVLFIDQERFKGETQRRFRSVLLGKQLNPKDIKDTLFIRCGTTTRLNLQSSFDAFRNYIGEIRPDLIIIDSFVSFHTAEENNRKDIQVVIEKIKELRTEFNCTFLFIDHESKGVFQDTENDVEPSAMRIAGSIGKPAAAELVLTVRKHGENESFVYMTKNNLAPHVAPFMVKISDLTSDKTQIKIEAL